MAVEFWSANTVSDLIQRDVLGLATTTSIDKGELTFSQQPGGDTTIWKGHASDSGIWALRSGDASVHFPSVCFSGDATAVFTPVDLAALGTSQGRPLQELVAEAAGLQANNRAVWELAL